MNGEQCSGSMAGNCNCGECQCVPGYSGPACECSPPDQVCVRSPGVSLCTRHTFTTLPSDQYVVIVIVVQHPVHIRTASTHMYTCKCSSLHSIQDQVCSGNGMCDCNSCKCNFGYMGTYCYMCNNSNVSVLCALLCLAVHRV